MKHVSVQREKNLMKLVHLLNDRFHALHFKVIDKKLWVEAVSTQSGVSTAPPVVDALPVALPIAQPVDEADSSLQQAAATYTQTVDEEAKAVAQRN